MVAGFDISFVIVIIFEFESNPRANPSISFHKQELER